VAAMFEARLVPWFLLAICYKQYTANVRINLI